MSISPLTFKSNTPLAKKNEPPKTVQKTTEKPNSPASFDPEGRMLQYPPIVIGLLNAFCWGSLGFIFDKAVSKIFKTEGNTKNSLIINGVIAAGMGTYSYIQAKKYQKANKPK